MPKWSAKLFLRRLSPLLLVLILWNGFIGPENLLLLRYVPVPFLLLCVALALLVVLSQTILPYVKTTSLVPVATRGSKRMFWILLVLVNFPVLWGSFVLFKKIAHVELPQTAVGESVNADQPNLRSLNLYPYTGWHIQPHLHQNGDVVSGDHGFFVDFSLTSPPVKEKGEVRIILLGGSTAQGWGGSSNDKMFYRLLEQKLGGKVKVINLAMAGSNTYQNFIALNKWGHSLNPDLILSFSGFNDLHLWDLNGSDSIYGFQPIQGFVLATRFSESSEWMKRLARYTSLFSESDLGAIVRLFRLRELGEKANRTYRAAHGYDRITPVQGASDQYAHAIQSISRDFKGIPILVAYQPAPTRALIAYEAFRNQVTARLDGVAGVRVIDLHREWMENIQERFPKAVDGIRLTDQGHEFVAEMLAKELRPTLSRLSSFGRQRLSLMH